MDASGLMCPQPVLLTRAALEALNPGEHLELRATDPHTSLDIEVFCATTGHHLVETRSAEGIWRFWIQKRAASQ